MTPRQIELIRTSLESVAREPERFATAFRTRAVAIDPSLAAVIAPAPVDQSAQALEGLLAVGAGLDTRESRAAKEQAFALSHRWPGIQPRHYPAIGQAMLDTLEVQLGGMFGHDAREACAQAFVLVAESLMARCYNPLGFVA